MDILLKEDGDAILLESSGDILLEIDTLNLTGMNIDSVKHHFDILEQRFGAGRRRSASVGSDWGEQTFTLTAGVLPDRLDESEIEDETRFEYYYNFWKDRMRYGNDPFLIEWRGKLYTVVFTTHDYTYQVFTSDLFNAGVELEQCAVDTFVYNSDGSITL